MLVKFVVCHVEHCYVVKSRWEVTNNSSDNEYSITVLLFTMEALFVLSRDLDIYIEMDEFIEMLKVSSLTAYCCFCYFDEPRECHHCYIWNLFFFFLLKFTFLS